MRLDTGILDDSRDLAVDLALDVDHAHRCADVRQFVGEPQHGHLARGNDRGEGA